MNIPQIRLQSVSAQIGIHTTNAKLNIEQKQANLSIQQKPAEIQTKTTPSKLTIDQTEAWADMDLKHIFRRIEDAAQQGYNDLLSGISRRVQEGEQLMEIEKGGNAIADIAKQRTQEQSPPVNIRFIPTAGSVKISYEPAKVNIKVNVNKPIIDVRVNNPTFEYQPGSVIVDLRRRNDLTIDFISNKVGAKVL
ncbi:hypothetical protein FS935_08705 [Metabacillus litoralis]|uniref:YviE n=1 Tax=Metabacillus litoralis TaxID=152268 RepID=A0A5C6W257_9BACI|nr:DUF6470 family protein [Metabacillus litoralis]TXC90977.1 hypothetical protein FS935_08705 [Metabacillus litoralis]